MATLFSLMLQRRSDMIYKFVERTKDINGAGVTYKQNP